MADKILIVEDDPQHLFMLTTLVRDWGYLSQAAKSGEEAVELTSNNDYSLILMDVRLGDELSGLSAMNKIKEGGRNQKTPVIIMTALMNYPDAVKAIKDGASDYLTKPLDFQALRRAMESALKDSAQKDNSLSKGELPKERGPAAPRAAKPPQKDDFFYPGESASFQNVMNYIELAAPTDAVVLITGESGVGKEVIARLIQEKSPRRDKPFITINCAALSDTLVESELFGHRKGAFTGADTKRVGRIKAGDGGTVFLDEIAETNPNFQAKLLRLIQEHEIQPLGSDESEKVDVRFIVATNREIKKEVEAGRFREDLYYRLEVITIHVPPLRERREDILPLARFFIDKFAREHRKSEIRGLSLKAEEAILKYPWPGNIRELQNAMERAVLLTTQDVIGEKFMPVSSEETKPPVASTELPLNLEELECLAVEKALKKAKWNKTDAAKFLGVTRKTLAAKIKNYNIVETVDNIDKDDD
ncbi:MAG: sigma-54 dependent transcriptional regulator [Deltaproteobacteria bacterium]|jgi:two-component system response regulator HydG|nr:sigma-54 dependent transcriptional regulator [Deltaproteobacteria bacterium]